MERRLLVTTIFILHLTFIFGQKGVFSGKITDKDTGEEIVGAAVFIEGTTLGTATDFNGDFSLEVMPGSYNFKCQFISYEPLVKQGITITAGAETVINFELANAELKLEEVKVVGKANREGDVVLLIEQKLSLIGKEAIGARQISIQGITDAASAVRRITGVTVHAGSQTVNVRGLGDRYNTTTLNGLPLPSNHAEYKNIDLALFPSEIIGLVSVEKSFSAALIGDVGGANLDIVSKYHSGDPSLEAGISTGYHVNSGKATDFYLQQGPGFSGFNRFDPPTEKILSNKYPFKNSWNPQKVNPFPDTDFSLTGGRSYKIGSGSLSIFATGSFDNGYAYHETRNRKFNGSDDEQSILSGGQFGYSTQTTGMLNLGYANVKNQYHFSSLFMNASDQNVKSLTGSVKDVSDPGQDTALLRRAEYERNIILVNQLMGKHDLGSGYDLNWKLGTNRVENIAPDRMVNIFIRSNSGEVKPATNDAGNNHRYFHDLNEQEFSGLLELSKSFGPEFNENPYRGKVTLGYFGRFKNRDFSAHQYNFRITDRVNPGPINPNDPDAYFNQSRLNQGIFSIVTFRGSANRPQLYSGSQIMNAGYLSLEYALSTRLSGLFGLRFEQILQSVEYATSLKAGENSFSEMNPFPSLSLRYAINEKQNLRFSASMSYTLPQFKETAPFLFEGITDATVGNPYLYPSKIYNGEIKWELFPGDAQLFSISAYGKVIQDPINRFVMASASNDFSYANTGDKGYVYGLEVEGKKTILDAPAPGGTRRLSLGMNASGMKTWQQLDNEKVKTESPKFALASFNKETEVLEGASPLMANMNLTYNRSWTEKNHGFSAALVYAYVSESLFLIGSSSLGNQYDQETNDLSFNLKAHLKNLGFTLSAKNILNQDQIRVQKNPNATHLVRSFSEGVKLGLGINYRF